MRPLLRTRTWLPLLLFALLAAPAAGQMVLVHKVPIPGAASGLEAGDNATLLTAVLPDGLFTVQAGTPVGKRSLGDLAAFAQVPDGSRFVVGTGAGEITAMDDPGNRLWSFSAGAPVTSLSSAGDNRVLYTAGETVGLLDPGGNEVTRRSLPGLKTGSISPGAGTVLVADPGSILALDPATLQTRWQAPLLGIAEVKALDAGGVAIDSKGDLYRLDDSGRFLQIIAATGPARLAVSPDGQRIAVAGRNEVGLFDINLRKTAGQGVAGARALVLSPEGNFLAVASEDRNIYLFALSDRYPAAPVKFESRPPGAAIAVDGVFRGVTPAVIPLERGNHSVELAREGYATHHAILGVSGGGEAVEAALVASASASGPALAPSVSTGGEDGGALLLLLLLAAGGGVAIFLARRRKAGAAQPSPPTHRGAGRRGSPKVAPPEPPVRAPPPLPAAPVQVPAPPPPTPGPGPDLPPGASAIVQERAPGYAYELFRALVASGAPGLAVTRRDPRKVREEVPGAEVYRLSSLPGERNLRPVDLELLLSAAEGHFSGAEGAVVLLEGVEYLQLHRGFTPILKLVTHLQERAASRKGRLLVAVGSGVLGSREMALLRSEGRAREMEEPPGRRLPPAGVTAGTVHLLLQKGPEGAYLRLKEWGLGGRKTLAVSRSSPEETRQRYRLEPGTRVVWLTTSKGEDRVDPSDLELLLKMVRDFLEEGEERAVLLEGVEHMAAIASFGAVQKFLGHMVDACIARRAAGLVPLDPYALEPAKVAYLGRELALLEGER